MGEGLPKGYPTKVGPTVIDGDVFAPGWEQSPLTDDGHEHEWESVLLARTWSQMEECVRCYICHCPRCGHLYDRNPCMLRRHHRTEHEYANGGREPVGGAA